jgi:hypothetical protein
LPSNANAKVRGRHLGALLAVTLAVYASCVRRTTWDLSYDHSLAADAQRVQGKACRADTDCDLFVCESGRQKCIARPCRTHDECWPNACIQHLCTRAPLQAGTSCEPLDWKKIRDPESDDAEAAYASLDGCACEPAGFFDKTWTEGDPCGSFPCTPSGCYVSKCSGDESCRFGLCSRHASGPHGYCVTNDAY